MTRHAHRLDTGAATAVSTHGVTPGCHRLEIQVVQGKDLRGKNGKTRKGWGRRQERPREFAYLLDAHGGAGSSCLPYVITNVREKENRRCDHPDNRCRKKNTLSLRLEHVHERFEAVREFIQSPRTMSLARRPGSLEDRTSRLGRSRPEGSPSCLPRMTLGRSMPHGTGTREWGEQLMLRAVVDTGRSPALFAAGVAWADGVHGRNRCRFSADAFQRPRSYTGCTWYAVMPVQSTRPGFGGVSLSTLRRGGTATPAHAALLRIC